MGISLKKGGGISLKKEATKEPLKRVTVGLGWTPPADGKRYDLDALCFMLGSNGMISDNKRLVFFNNLKSPCESVIHNGDSRDGNGEGDDETISVDLTKIPEDVSTLSFCVTIDEAEKRQQTFSNVRDAYIRIMDADTGTELARYSLEHMPDANAMVFGKMIKKDGAWDFMAIDEPRIGGIEALAESYGFVVTD